MSEGFSSGTPLKRLFLQEQTKGKIQSVLRDICGDDCKLDIFQEDNSDEIIVTGKYVEGQWCSWGETDRKHISNNSVPHRIWTNYHFLFFIYLFFIAEDVSGMVDKFNNDNIKDKVENYFTWEKK